MINKNFLNKKFLFITLTSLIAISSIYLIPEVYKRKYWLKTNFPKLFILYKNAQFKLESFQNERKSKLEVEQIKKPVFDSPELLIKNKYNSIDDYSFNDFQINNYKFNNPIKMDMRV